MITQLMLEEHQESILGTNLLLRGDYYDRGSTQKVEFVISKILIR